MKRIKIVLSGVETNNKGAELMLYAILQEIERKFPNAIVYVALDSVRQGLNYIKTPLRLKEKPIYYARKWYIKLHLGGIASRLHIPIPWYIFHDRYAIYGTDYFIDGSGFAFSDQLNVPKWFIQDKIQLWKSNAEVGAKLIFLPQALGPFTKDYSRIQLANIAKYAEVIMPRETVSYKYIKESGLVDMEKVKKFTDFTSLVNGIIPQQYQHLKNAICVIPNMRMIDKGAISFENYIHLLTSIIKNSRDKGHRVYLLNHEGAGDEKLAYQCNEALKGEIEVVTGLNALEIKGIISTAYLVITSRFHGVASALNTCVPCLATSWSHKYAELFRDYELTDCILPLDNSSTSIAMVNKFLDETENKKIRDHLSKQLPRIQSETRDMWNLIWSM